MKAKSKKKERNHSDLESKHKPGPACKRNSGHGNSPPGRASEKRLQPRRSAKPIAPGSVPSRRPGTGKNLTARERAKQSKAKWREAIPDATKVNVGANHLGRLLSVLVQLEPQPFRRFLIVLMSLYVYGISSIGSKPEGHNNGILLTVVFGVVLLTAVVFRASNEKK